VHSGEWTPALGVVRPEGEGRNVRLRTLLLSAGSAQSVEQAPRDSLAAVRYLLRHVGLSDFNLDTGTRSGAQGLVLGRRFSAFITIQEQHSLVTDGLYAYVRHPSYLGGLIATAGWALAFRSAIGLLLAAVLFCPTVARLRAEEALLSSQFGGPYAEYRARTWRVVPFVY
jgi:hypothetical protein